MSALFTRDWGLPTGMQGLVFPKDLKGWHDRNLVKKHAKRKGRYLFALPAMLASLKQGRLGAVQHLNTDHPLLYIDFAPHGRLKLCGNVTHSHNPFVSLADKAGDGSIVCEDVFYSVVDFSRWAWVGTAEANPQEKPLPLPEALAGAAKAVPGFASKFARPARRSGRAGAKRPVSYADDAGSGGSGSEGLGEQDKSGDTEEVEWIDSGAGGAGSSARKRARKEEEEDVICLSD